MFCVTGSSPLLQVSRGFGHQVRSQRKGPNIQMSVTDNDYDVDDLDTQISSLDTLIQNLRDDAKRGSMPTVDDIVSTLYEEGEGAPLELLDMVITGFAIAVQRLAMGEGCCTHCPAKN